MKRISLLMVTTIVLGLLVGCTYNVQMTNKDVAAWMNNIYNAQYRDYLSWFDKDAQGNYTLKPTVPDEQKKILVAKKKILTQLHPLLITYSEYAKTGIVPAGMVIADIEVQAVNYVNQLIMLDGGK